MRAKGIMRAEDGQETHKIRRSPWDITACFQLLKINSYPKSKLNIKKAVVVEMCAKRYSSYFISWHISAFIIRLLLGRRGIILKVVRRYNLSTAQRKARQA